MKSNYKPLSEYIREVNTRNTDGSINTLLGINIDKYFMPSVANTVGTDLTVYKVVKKGQFACNRMHVGRDKRLPVALSRSDADFIVSPAYDVFEIINEMTLDPEYLMMWFSRKEFDRNAWFYTDADVRGGLNWDAFCNMQLPIPTIEEQKEIVKEYYTIINRMKLNEQFNRKLEEVSRTIYKQWFVNFDFPDCNGNPYLSSGGEMNYSEELKKDIPKGWGVSPIGALVTDSSGGDWGKGEPEGNYNKKVLCLRGTDIPNFTNGILDSMPERYILDKNFKGKCLTDNQLIVEISGGSPEQSTGRPALISEGHINKLKHPIICSNFCRSIRPKNDEYSYFLYRTFRHLYDTGLLFNYENSTTGVKNFNLNSFLSEEPISVPPVNLLIRFNKINKIINQNIITSGQEIEKLSGNHDLLLADFLIGHVG